VIALKVVLTGRPGSGKSTIIAKVADSLKRSGWAVGGVVSPEVNQGGVRVGFSIVDIMSGRRGCLATALTSEGPRFGRYHVNLRDIEDIGVKAIRDSLATSDLTVIDEIGPMELKSPAFDRVVREAFDGEKSLLASVHWTLAKLYAEYKSIKIVTVTPENRGYLADKAEQLFLGEGA
jgi:nucleoside-triphosphatase